MGKVVTLNTTDKSYTEESKDSIVDKMITGVTAMFGDANKAYTSDIVMWGQVATNAANTVLTSKFTRKRAAEGKKAVGGIFF